MTLHELLAAGGVGWLAVLEGSVENKVLAAFDNEADATAYARAAAEWYAANHWKQDRPSHSWDDPEWKKLSPPEKRKRHKEGGVLPVARLYNNVLSFGLVRLEGKTVGEYRPLFRSSKGKVVEVSAS